MPDELKRAQLAGAKVREEYIVHPDDGDLDWPRVIGLTRTIGDLEFGPRCGVIATPFFNEVELNASHKYLVVASDGLWDVLGPEEVAGRLQGSPAECIELMKELILERAGSVSDDLALVIKKLF